MPKTIKINFPAMPTEGDEAFVSINGLGNFKNGTSTEVSDEQIALWYSTLGDAADLFRNLDVIEIPALPKNEAPKTEAPKQPAAPKGGK